MGPYRKPRDKCSALPLVAHSTDGNIFNRSPPLYASWRVLTTCMLSIGAGVQFMV